MGNLRGRVGGLGGREGKNETRWDQEGDKPKGTLNLTKQTEGCWGDGGYGEGGWIMDIEEGM